MKAWRDWRFELSPLAQLAVVAYGLMLFPHAERINGFFWWLNGSNLLIHEAGHPLFSMLFLGNRFMMFVGGTALQLAVPLAFWWDFMRRGMPRSADACVLWLGQNFLHIAPYVADARAQELPLVGGGEHDWRYLLGLFGLLEHDLRLAHLSNLVGCVIMSAAIYAFCAHSTRKFVGPGRISGAWKPPSSPPQAS